MPSLMNTFKGGLCSKVTHYNLYELIVYGLNKEIERLPLIIFRIKKHLFFFLTL